MRSGSKLKSLKDDKDDIIHTKLMFSIMISGEQGDEVVKCRKKVRERRVLMETQWACRAFVSASCNIESFHHADNDGGDTFTFC